MDALILLIAKALGQVWTSFTHNWPFLLFSVFIAVALKLYLDPQKISAWLQRYRKVGVLGATIAAVGTPLCSCGTTAVILGMMASTLPWAPIVAFMVSSPLTSPQELVYSAGLFGWPFAIAFFISSIVLGFLGGAVAEFFESRGWLKNQSRFARKPAETPAASIEYSTSQLRDIRSRRPVMVLQASSAVELPQLSAAACCGPTIAAQPVSTIQLAPVLQSTCGCSGGQGQAVDQEVNPLPTAGKVDNRLTTQFSSFAREVYITGGRLVWMFFGFAFIGYLLNGLIPQEWVLTLFGEGNLYSVPLAATLGLPFYINSEASLPLIRALIDGGMNQGAALAFLITGAGTSFGAVAGALTIARWRIIALVVGTLWVGAVATGIIYNVLLPLL